MFRPVDERMKTSRCRALALTAGLLLAAFIGFSVWLSGGSDGVLRRLDTALLDLAGDGSLRESRYSWVGWVLAQTGGRGFNFTWVTLLAVAVWVKRRTVQPLVVLAAVAVLHATTVTTLKAIFQRTAPASGVDEFFQAGHLSYPSGHEVNSILIPFIGLWIARTWLASNRTLVQVVTWYALLAPAVCAIAVVLVKYHWPTDVIGGALLGAFLVVTVQIILDILGMGPQSSRSR